MSAMVETSDHAQSQRSAPEESRVNSRLGPVSELTGAQRRFSGRAEPRLQPRLIGAAEPAQPRMSAMLETSDHAQSQRSAPEESRVNSRLGPVSELTAL